MFDWLKSVINPDTQGKKPSKVGTDRKRRPTDTRKNPPNRNTNSSGNPISRTQLNKPKPLKEQIFKTKEQQREEAREAERQKRKVRGLAGQGKQFKINNGTPRERERPAPEKIIKPRPNQPTGKPRNKPITNTKPKAPTKTHPNAEPRTGSAGRESKRPASEVGRRPQSERKVQPSAMKDNAQLNPNQRGRPKNQEPLTEKKRKRTPQGPNNKTDPKYQAQQEKINKRLEKKYGITEADIHPDKKPDEKVSTREKMRRENWGYTRTKNYSNEPKASKEFEIQEIKEEKVVSKRAKLSTVKNINDVSFFGRINLVTYFNQKESGKFDEKEVQEEYKKNTGLLKKESSLKYFLLESARRNLEYGEFPEIKLQIDPHLEDELFNCLESKLLASYDIQVEKQHAILTKMNVDPIIISMRLKVI